MKNFIPLYQVLLCLIILCGVKSNSQTISDGLIFYYPFHGSTIDKSINGFHAVALGPELVCDRFGVPDEAFHFDGIDDYILIPDLEAIESDFPVTFAFWTLLDTLNLKLNQFIGTDQRFNDYTGFRVSTSADNSGSIVVNYGNGYGSASAYNRVSQVSETKLTTGIWYHVASVCESPHSVRIFINGIDAGGYTTGDGDPFVAYSSDGQPKLGTFPGNYTSPETNYLLGSLDDVAMWNRALSDQEVFNLYTDDLLGNDNIAYDEQYVCNLFPNPARDYVYISIPVDGFSDIYSAEIISVNGAVIRKSREYDNGMFVFPISDLNSGLYMVRVSRNNEMYYSSRFIKK